jgi:hypothetical protein
MIKTSNIAFSNQYRSNEQLYIARGTLLTIRQLQEKRDFDPDELHRRRLMYHSYASSLDEICNDKCSDPITSLPPELFAQIIYAAAFDGLAPWKLHKANYMILNLTLVSRQWMEFITGTSLYWCHIILDESVPDCSAIVSTFLHFSRNLPITVHLVPPFTLTNSAYRPLLLQHRNRITDIVYNAINDWEIEMQDLSVIFQSLTSQLFPLICLKSVHHIGQTIDDSTIGYLLDNCPALNEIRGITLSGQILRRIILRGCKYIRFNEELDHMLPLLENAPSLTSIDCTYRPSGKSNSLYNGSIGKESLRWQNLSLRHLNLSLAMAITERLIHLVSLSVWGHPEVLLRLIAQIYRLYQLKELTLGLWLAELTSEEFVFPPSSIANTNVASLFLTLKPITVKHDRSIFEDVPVQEFFEMAIKLLPSITNLSLKFEKYEKILGITEFFNLEALNQLNYLQKMEIWSMLQITPPGHFYELPPCEALVVHCPITSFAHLSSKGTKGLHVHILTRSELECSMEACLWPSIETLTCPAQLMASFNGTFDHLRDLSLRSRSYTSEYTDITRFCRNLALQPALCPALERLDLDQCPEWDIYFILLENRLIQSVNGIKPFASVTLPSYTPRSLCCHISEILQNRLPDRPSNSDLSLFGTFPDFLDERMYVFVLIRSQVVDTYSPNSPDCLRCIMTRTRCSLSSTLNNKTISLVYEDRHLQSVLDTPVYPRDEREILMSWEWRREKWNTLTKRDNFRSSQCGMYGHLSSEPPIRLDRFSSLGTLHLLLQGASWLTLLIKDVYF